MKIAQKKRRESIVEYLLYMWSVEDLIRANDLDIEKIKKNVISQYGIADEAELQEVVEWWDNLVEMMKREKKEKGGHVRVVQGLSNDMYNFHLYLLTQTSEAAYQNAFQAAWPDLNALMQKMPNKGEGVHHVDVAMTAVYDYYLLKMKGQTILADTKNALLRISHFLALLSQKYLQAEKDLEK